MYYPRFTKVIVNFFMTKDQSIPRRNKVNWHFARDDYMFTTIKVVSRHEDTQLYGAIFPDELTNEAIKDSESYKEYYAIASGAEPPKTKASAAKIAKKKQPAKTSKAKGLTVLYEVALTEAEQMKLATKRSLIQTHSSYASGSGADEGTGDIPGVPDVPTYGSDDEQISWKTSEEEDDDEVAVNDDDDENDDNDAMIVSRVVIERTESDNDGDDLFNPKFSTHDEEDKEEDSFDPRVQTPSHVESTDDEDSDEEIQDANGLNALVSGAQSIQKVNNRVLLCHLALFQPCSTQSRTRCIDSLFNLNNESTSLVDVPVTTIPEPPLLSAITLPLPPTPLITHLQQIQVPTPPTIPSSSLQDLPNFSSLFGFDHRLKTLENNFSEFNQMNQFAAAVSLIPGIVDAYLANKMHEAVKTAVQLQSERLRDEAQAENADFINKLDDNIKKIIKDQVKEQVKAQVSKILPKIEKTVNEQLKAEVLTRSSNESKTSHAIAANLSELELKKILIDKMESNKSIHRSDEQKNLYKALVDAYESDKLILDTYGDTVSFKRRRDDEDKDEEPSAGSNRGSKRRRAGKEPESTSAPKEKTSKTTGKSTEGSKSHHKSAGESAQAEEPMHTAKDLEEPAHQEFKTGVTEDQPNEETFQHPDWFQKPAKPPTPDRDWNKTLPDAHGPVQPWLSSLAQMEDPRESFNELMDTPLDFSAFVMNRLKVDTLTPELLVGPTFELMKGSCKSLVELEYFFEEVYKATTDQLDWNNPKSRTYTTSVTKTKAADYGHIKWIEDLVPNTMWSQVPVSYDKHALWGISHWGRKRQQFYGFAANRESARDHLDWITVRRDDDKLYKFKEGDFNRLRIQDKEDMLRVEDLQLGVESYQKKLNLTKPDTYRSDLKRREAYTAYSNPRGFIYQNKDKKNRLMRIDELHKFSDGTLNDVRTALDDRLKGIRMKYLP
ncbi:hypothetical protein Tco_1182487 [Tanacetum coccineum]